MHIHTRDKSPSLDFHFSTPRTLYTWLYVPLSFLSIPFFGGMWIGTHMNKNLLK